MNVGDRGEEIFLGREIVERRSISERMSQRVDDEMRVLLDQAYELARKVISENLDKLHALAKALLERETLDAEEINIVFAGKELPPLPEPEVGVESKDALREAKAGRKAASGIRDVADVPVKGSLKPAASFEGSKETTKPETSR